MILELPLRIVIAESFAHTVRQTLDGDPGERIAGPQKDPAGIHAYRQKVEPLVFIEQPDEWFDVKTVPRHHHLLKVEGKPHHLEVVFRDKEHQAPGEMMPEGIITQEMGSLFQEASRLGWSQTVGHKLILRLLESILEPRDVLPDLDSVLMRR